MKVRKRKKAFSVKRFRHPWGYSFEFFKIVQLRKFK